MIMNTPEILAENLRRMSARQESYDPERGIGCLGERAEASEPGTGRRALVPVAMLRDPAYPAASESVFEWRKLRCRHDFEYWCATCATIRDKLSGQQVNFILNAPQRRVAAVLEGDRLAGRPIRMILLKARQWGGSTLVQFYMAWIQLCHKTNWHSLICAHVKDTAGVIRGMYTKLLEQYPDGIFDSNDPNIGKPVFKPYERSQNVRTIIGRDCRVTLGSAEKQEAIRGSDFAMAHLSETAFWPSTTTRSPADFIRAVCGGVAMVPYSLIVMESTANGVGNYFHSEWLRCSRGEGDKHAVFVPWYEIEIYRLEPPDPAAFVESWDEYEAALWERGLCLDQIYWYSTKRREYSSAHQMMAEFPTTDVEAFVNTGSGVFRNADIEALRLGCRAGSGYFPPRFRNSDATTAAVRWKAPEAGRSYVVAVDVGGRSSGADWSVVLVMSRDGAPEVVAQWRGHTDHDILADMAIAMAREYNGALLVIESNTLETEADGSNLFVLNRISSEYSNLYHRRSYDLATRAETLRVGFHTNRSTKAMVVNTLIASVRDRSYIERDNRACDELATYEQRPNGSFGAKTGFHDDLLMTRAIALHIIAETAPPLTPSEQQALWRASAPWSERRDCL